MIEVPLYKAYLFPNGVYDGCITKVEKVENSFYKQDPENSVQFQLKITFEVDHKDKKFPGRTFNIGSFVSLSLSGKSGLFKYYEALTGDKMTIQQMEEASKPAGTGLSFGLDEQKMLGRKVKLVIEQTESKQGNIICKVHSILPEKTELAEEPTS